MSKIFLYAEVLTNIRQVTLYASLETALNEETNVHISSDKKRITVRHEEQIASIYLPTEISGTAEVSIPAERKKEISVRLEIADSSELLPKDEEPSSVEAPWSARDLSAGALLQCKACQASIVPSGAVTQWKDLPSENWAEMMDFWHCHKPHDHRAKEDGESAEAKGYASTSKLALVEGTGFVDTVSFLCHASDCTGVKFASPKISSRISDLMCANCDNFIGQNDDSLNARKLFKSRLLVKPGEDLDFQRFDAATFICAQLLVLIESQATRKFVLHSSDQHNDHHGLFLWVFNPDIHYSSSERGPSAYRASKIFYQTTSRPQNLLDENTTSTEEVVLPPCILEELEQILKESTEILPQSARMFQEWQVGLLDRYESHPIVGMNQQPLAQKASPMISWRESVRDLEGIEGLLA